jgi:hypothetical protein
MYWVRHVVLDTDKLLDPEAARLVHKFSSSPKTGLSIELHDQQAALDKILRIHGKYQDNLDLTTNGEPITKELTDTERVARLTAIFDKVRARRDQQLVP